MESKNIDCALSISNSYEQLQNFVAQSPFAIAMFDKQMVYIALSQRWIDDHPSSVFNYLGKSLNEIFPEIPERWIEIHKRCLNGATEKSDQDVFVRADGKVEYLRWEVRPWKYADSSIGGLIIYSENITEQVKAKIALSESESRFRTLFENAPEAVVLLDPDTGKFEDANINAERLFGLNLNYLKGRTLSELSQKLQANDKTASELADEAFRAAVEGSSITQEWVIASSNNLFVPTELRLVKLYSGGKLLLRCSFTDISERKANEQQIVEIIKDLTRSNNELQEFAFVAAHDLCSPLNSIINWIDVLESLIPEPRSKDMIQAIKFIRDNSSKSAQLIRDVMEIAKLNATYAGASENWCLG